MYQRPAPVYLGDHTALAKTIYGDKIYVDTRDVTIAPHILMDGEWERWISEAMIPMLRCALFVDVGANVGWYTLLAARFGAEQVRAFEPVRRMFELLQNTISVNGYKDVVPLKVGLSNLETSGMLMTVDPRVAGSSTCFELEFYSHTRTQESVILSRLDGLIDSLRYQGKPVVLKIDVEGYEPRVVAGSVNLLTSADCTAFVEYHADPKGETRLNEMLEQFEALGYRMAHVQTDSSLKPINREKLANVPEADMLCFRRFKL